LGGSLSEFKKLDTATVIVKKQRITSRGMMSYSEDPRLLQDFLKEAEDLE